jgi:hypothetical protein
LVDKHNVANARHLPFVEAVAADLGIVTSRGNAGSVRAVQWSLPG